MNRWLLAGAAVLFQLALGAVYSWSVFSKALQADDSAFNLSKSQAALPFSFTIGMIFLGTYLGGRIQDRRGPRVVALAGGVIYALGILLASVASDDSQLWLLILGYGVVAGFGLGLAYIVPIAVGGFGFGAVLTSPVAQRLVDHYSKVPTRSFIWLGIAYLIMALIGASQFRNPPEGYAVPGWEPKATGRVVETRRNYTQTEALRTPQWYLLTAILCLNVTAGIGLISVIASASKTAGYGTAAAATLTGVMGLFNGGGRIFWAWVSGLTGRMSAFLLMLALQGVCLLILPHAGTAAFAVLAAVIYLCYGGGFGTMPATAGDFFGLRNAGAIYGLMIIAWSIGGVVGPQVVAKLADGDSYTTAFTTIGVIALVALALPLITRAPREDKAEAAAVPAPAAE
jgi:OFA family oxalate/formate antiporter-like MFS transporter